MARKQRYILSSTHIDSHGYAFTKGALEDAVLQVNGSRKMRLGLEHNRTFPPFGAVMNGEVFQGEDKAYYLAADNIFFDKREYATLEDGTELIRESFSEGGFPFIECKEPEVCTIEVTTDPVNFEDHKEVFEINRLTQEESGLEVKTQFSGRKSHIPDHETIISITKIIALGLGIVKTKIPEKIGEAVGDDIAKFYRLMSRLAIETIKRAKPVNRPKNFVITYPNPDCIIELVITTHKHDSVLNALVKEKLSLIADKIEQLKMLKPEKVQFVYSEDNNWEFNYLLSKDGATIGIPKAFHKRNVLYNEILKAQEERES